MKRGIITSNMGNIRNERGNVAKPLSYHDILYYSLYWDKVVIPTNNFIHISPPAGFVEEGLIETDHFRMNGSLHSSQLQEIAHDHLIKSYNQRKDDQEYDWNLFHNIENLNKVNQTDIVEKSIIRFNLGRCLPIPSHYVKPSQIRDFKQNRKDELDALHSVLNDYFIDIIQHSDLSIRRIKADDKTNELKRVLRDYKTVHSEKFKHSKVRDYILDFNLQACGAPSLGIGVDSIIGNGFNLGSYAGVTLGAICYVLGRTKASKIVENKDKLHFVKDAMHKGIILQPMRGKHS